MKYCKALGRMCKHFAYQFHYTFVGFPENVGMRSVDHSGTVSKFVVYIRHCNSTLDYDVDHTLSCGG